MLSCHSRHGLECKQQVVGCLQCRRVGERQLKLAGALGEGREGRRRMTEGQLHAAVGFRVYQRQQERLASTQDEALATDGLCPPDSQCSCSTLLPSAASVAHISPSTAQHGVPNRCS